MNLLGLCASAVVVAAPRANTKMRSRASPQTRFIVVPGTMRSTIHTSCLGKRGLEGVKALQFVCPRVFVRQGPDPLTWNRTRRKEGGLRLRVCARGVSFRPTCVSFRQRSRNNLRSHCRVSRYLGAKASLYQGHVVISTADASWMVSSSQRILLRERIVGEKRGMGEGETKAQCSKNTVGPPRLRSATTRLPAQNF